MFCFEPDFRFFFSICNSNRSGSSRDKCFCYLLFSCAAILLIVFAENHHLRWVSTLLESEFPCLLCSPAKGQQRKAKPTTHVSHSWPPQSVNIVRLRAKYSRLPFPHEGTEVAFGRVCQLQCSLTINALVELPWVRSSLHFAFVAVN